MTPEDIRAERILEITPVVLSVRTARRLVELIEKRAGHLKEGRELLGIVKHALRTAEQEATR